MKKLLVMFFMVTMLAACGDNKSNTSDVNSQDNTEENASDVATPDTTNTQLDSAGMQSQDSIR